MLHPATLGEMVERFKYPPFPCACRGGLDCCIQNWKRHANLQRGAHIMARLLTDLREKRSNDRT